MAELRAELREELEAEMAEKFERRRGLVEFAEELCGGDAGLSASPEDVVAALEELTDEQAERVKALLGAKVVDFSERGSARDGKGSKKELPTEWRQAIESGAFTMKDLEGFDHGLGDLSEYAVPAAE